jgi:hypothetical protein
LKNRRGVRVCAFPSSCQHNACIQALTKNIGYPKLREHLGATVAYMTVSKDYPDFMEVPLMTAVWRRTLNRGREGIAPSQTQQSNESKNHRTLERQ